jgi:hypothetical protein
MTTNGSEPAPQEVQCLFMVVVDLDGSSRAVIDPNERFMAHREATPKDIFPALSNILADFTAMKTAEAVVAFQMQVARSAQEASQAAAARQEGNS